MDRAKADWEAGPFRSGSLLTAPGTYTSSGKGHAVGGTHYNKKGLVADSGPGAMRRELENEVLGRAWTGIGEDLWEPGDGPVSRAIEKWLDENLPPADDNTE